MMCGCDFKNEKNKMIKSSKFDDLKKIYVLRTLSEEKSLNKTAQIHKVTPSAVSQSIKTLEINLGYPVIIKQDDSWKLTEKGQALIDQMKVIFDAMTDISGLEPEEGLKIGSLAIGTYESLALDLVQQLSADIRADFPNVKLNFQIDRSANLIKKIQSGELCLSIVTQNDFMPDSFLTSTLVEDTLGLYTAAANEINDSSEVHNTEIIGMISSHGDGLPRYFKKFLDQIPELRPNFICDSFEVLRNLAEAGTATVILPQRVAKKSGTKLKKINIKNQNFDGKHQIQLIASGTCDRKEFDYVLSLLKQSLITN